MGSGHGETYPVGERPNVTGDTNLRGKLGCV